MNPLERDLAYLQAVVDDHLIWDCDLFKACKRGELSHDDFRALFGQYTHYSNNFTRYLAGVLLSCEDDLMRAKLSENLWEEGGGSNLEERHAELFRRFLIETIGISNPRAVPVEDFTDVFVHRYLRGASHPDHTYGCAFLALGTEGIVARMYRILVDGMLKIGIPEEELGFFNLHIMCDDEHAATLLEMMVASRERPDWRAVCERAIDDALTARADFFEVLYARRCRVLPGSVVEGVRSMEPTPLPASARRLYAREERGETVPPRSDAPLQLAIEQRRMNFDARQALDVLTLDLPPGTSTHRHRHAHESVLHVLEGSGSIAVGDQSMSVSAGDTVFVPRWEVHQTCSTGIQPLRVLVVTDSRLCASILATD